LYKGTIAFCRQVLLNDIKFLLTFSFIMRNCHFSSGCSNGESSWNDVGAVIWKSHAWGVGVGMVRWQVWFVLEEMNIIH